MNAVTHQTLLAKIAELPDDRIAEVANFVDFIRSQEAHSALVRVAMTATEPSLARVWDNPEDDVYNDL